METKKEYIAPTLTVVSFKVEQGYSGSAEFSLFQDFQLLRLNDDDDYNSQAQEIWSEDNSYFGSGW